MAIGLVGRKLGMTRIFTDQGESIPVTLVEVLPNRITQVKTKAAGDTHHAVQITTGTRRASRVTKAMAGHFAAANTEAGRGVWEFPILETEVENYKNGDAITADFFEAGQIVDVTATSKGKGFAGVVKRHNFRTQDATHGNSLSHRAPGSIG